MPEIFHHFVPAHAAESLHSIDLDKLWAGGKRLILMDVDHTLVKWKAEEFAPEILDWVQRAHGLGFGLCIISNTRRVERLGRLVAALNEHLGNPEPPSPALPPPAHEPSPQGEGGPIQTVRGRFKPSRAMFRLALIKFKCKPEQAVMIGDQLMTDILGANRAGIDAIWVRKMEGKEFIGTRLVNRMMERLLRSAIYKGLVAPVDEAAPAGPVAVADNPIVHQLVKFAIVGGSGFVIDFGIRWYLEFHAPWGGRLLSQVFGSWLQESFAVFRNFSSPGKAALPFFIIVSAGLAIINNFIWNRAWTFEIRSREERATQFRRFVLVSVIGMGLNALISSALHEIIHGHEQRSLAVATIIATFCVAIWNFCGYRFYAFRPRKR